MKKIILVCCLLFIASSAFGSYKDGFVRKMPKYMEGELLVKYRGKMFAAEIRDMSAREESINLLNRKLGVSKIKRIFRFGEIYKLTMPKEINIESAASEYRRDPNVEYAEPNYIRQICTPDDPYYKEYPNDPNQWGLFKIGLTSIESVTSGWQVSTGDASVVIAVVDTGVDYNHPDLSNNIWINSADPIDGIDNDNNGFVDDYRGWNFVSVPTSDVWPGEHTGPDNNPVDFEGHGTHVAGIASAVTNNSTGCAGTGWNCKIMAVRAGFMAYDGGGYLTDEDASKAIEYAADNGANVINMSWGDTYYGSTIAEAIGYATGKGVNLVAAAGNAYSDIEFYPAASERVIAVAATDVNDRISMWTFYAGSSYGKWVDVSAPGGSGYPESNTWIYSTLPTLEVSFRPSDYGYNTGTSMASPFVSGLVGLIKAKFPSWTKQKIENQIKYTTDYVGLSQMGTGRINAYKALTSPQAGITSPSDGDIVYAGSVSIIGIATDEIGGDYNCYTLEAKSWQDTSWTLIATSTEAKTGTLGIWNIPDSEPLGVHTLRLTVIDTSGNSSEADTVVRLALPGKLRLLDSITAPNPFNPLNESTRFIFTLSYPATDIKIRIYDIAGNLIWQRVFVFLDAGKHDTITWNGESDFHEIVPNGLYLYQIAIKGQLMGKGKIIVLK